MTLVRRAVLAGLAAFVLAVALAPGIAGAAPNPSCGQSCTTSHPSTLTTREKPTPASCVRDASCGGGGVLTMGTALFVFALAAGIGVVTLTLTGRRFTARRVKIPSGTLLAARLFHPPRLALGR